ncbi:hypothetical protein NtB2_00088 [Lactococcus termiticola]|uniref:Uncharacterized protein n=1 Tax=Lactococcus termiticola TaxID=2169526 RepID=A0A2R5HDU9_9LACT|nr:hypothetical protein NtB2_00088 [Lactococcus termiticola]
MRPEDVIFLERCLYFRLWGQKSMTNRIKGLIVITAFAVVTAFMSARIMTYILCILILLGLWEVD